MFSESDDRGHGFGRYKEQARAHADTDPFGRVEEVQKCSLDLKRQISVAGAEAPGMCPERMLRKDLSLRSVKDLLDRPQRKRARP